MTTTCLEHLPTELWLCLFRYFNLLEIVRSFSFLNRTIDSLIRSHHAPFAGRIPNILDLKRLDERSVTPFFNIDSLHVETHLHKEHVYSLNSLAYLTSIDHQLTSLTIHRVTSVELLNQICRLPDLRTLEINFGDGIEGRLPFFLPPNNTRLILDGSIDYQQLISLPLVVPTFILSP